MAEILGLGLSHYPPLYLPDADMASLLRWTLQDPSIPAQEKDPKNWPAAMRAEWADDFGDKAAADGARRDKSGGRSIHGTTKSWQRGDTADGAWKSPCSTGSAIEEIGH